jgi:hypothetical protein
VVGGACSASGIEDERIYVIVRKAKGKEQPGRPRHSWVDNIKMDIVMIGWGGVGWIGLAQDGKKWRALVNVVMNLRVA